MKSYLIDLLSHATKFDMLEYVLLTPEGDKLHADAVLKDNSFRFKAESPAIDEISDPCCLCNFKYLSKILSIEQIKGSDGEVTVKTGRGIEGKDIIQSMTFKGPRMKVGYELIDPKAASVTRKNLAKLQWGVVTTVEPAHHAEFNDAATLQKLSDASKTDFRARVDDGKLYFVFGNGENRKIDLLVAEDASFTEIGCPSFDLNKALTMMSVMRADGGGVLSVSDKAMKLDCQSGENVYTFVLPRNVD